MNKDHQATQVVRKGLDAIKSRFSHNNELPVLTDILIQANPINGTLTIFDDDDNEIFSDIIEEWVGNNSDSFYDDAKKLLHKHIKDDIDDIMELSILKPFEFILIDEEKETVCEILLVDDDLIEIDHETFMKDLDKDLDNFINKLLKE